MHYKIRSYSVLLLMVFAFLAPFSMWGQVKMSHPIRLQWGGVVGTRRHRYLIIYGSRVGGIREYNACV